VPPVRTITHGPRHHWFGYYDKFQFDPTNRYVLGMEVPFENRTPHPEDVVKIGMVDLKDNDRWIELGQTVAWCWQQGCMLQWIPGTKSQILWNDRRGDRFVCRILDVETGEGRTIPSAIYALSPDGKSAVAADFRRINDVRPGYGYAGPADPHASDLAPRDSGIFRVDLETGETELIVSLADVAKMGTIPGDPPSSIKHYFNHLLFSPDGSRFLFLHRWRFPNGRRRTRLLTANANGSDVRIVDDNGYTSHIIWRDPRHILVQSEQPSHGVANYLFEDKQQGEIEVVGYGKLHPGGHLTYLPGNEWILNDSQPHRVTRNQNPHLYLPRTDRRVSLGEFHSPKQYTGEWRVDTHPRASRDGRLVCIDSPHTGEGRQLHLIDISGIVG